MCPNRHRPTSVLGLGHCVLLVLDEFSTKNGHEPFLVSFGEQRVQHRLEVGTVGINEATTKRQLWTWVRVSGRHCFVPTCTIMQASYQNFLPPHILKSLLYTNNDVIVSSDFPWIFCLSFTTSHPIVCVCPPIPFSPCPSPRQLVTCPVPSIPSLTQTKLHVPFSHAPFSRINLLHSHFARRHISLILFSRGALSLLWSPPTQRETDSLLLGQSASSGGVKNRLTRTKQQRSCWRSGSPRMSSSCHPGSFP